MAKTASSKKLTEALYEHNLELAVKNKTLSLLEKLYQTGILTLTPEALAEDIAKTIREDLNLEFAGILVFDKEADSLTPLAFAKSERLAATLHKLGFLLRDIKITEVSKHGFFRRAAYDRSENLTSDIKEAWREIIRPEHLAEIEKESNLKTMLLYPLMTDQKVLGVLLLGLNRDYHSLNAFEKESIKSFINVIALSFDKVYLYKDLQDANVSLTNLIQQRESLIHLVTHKVKGAFTRSKYIFAEMLEGTFGAIPPQLKNMAEHGLESDNEGIITVDLVLNAANMQKGIVKYDMKPTDLKEVVADVVDQKAGPAKAKGLPLQTDLGDPNCTVIGDKFWLKEVLLNLVDNAIKYAGHGAITVGLARRDSKVVLYVKDTGIGIADEDKKVLFTEGGRGEDAVRVNVDSTGYGLYTVKLIIDAHKGRVWVESEVGKGSTFFVEFLAEK